MVTVNLTAQVHIILQTKKKKKVETQFYMMLNAKQSWFIDTLFT